MTELKCSEDVALNRIAAARLLAELPEIKSQIESGALSLSHLAIAKTLFRKKNFSRAEKLELLNEFENQSVRTAKKIVAKVAPEALRYDKIKHLTENLAEITFTAPVEIETKIERLKGVLAHSHPAISLGDLFCKLCDLGLETWKTPGTSRVTTRQKPDSEAGIRRAVFQRDADQCVKCGSIHALQADHIVPQAAGGAFTLENLRTLCRNCNQRAAIEYFGRKKMEPFLRSPFVHYTIAISDGFCILPP